MAANKNKDFIAFVVLNVALIVPAAVALSAIKLSQQHLDPSATPNPSPLGYTVSLGIFLIPNIIFGTMLFVPTVSHMVFAGQTQRSLQMPFRLRAFFMTLVILLPLGILLDTFLGKTFFVFSNTDAVLGGKCKLFLMPEYDLPTHGLSGLFSSENWERFVPIEEYAFYLLGFVAVLLTYIWSENVLFRGDKVEFGQRIPRVFRSRTSTALFWLGVGITTTVIALAVRANIGPYPKDDSVRFPGYSLYLLWAAVLPTCLLFFLSYQFINWRALSLSWLFIVLISQFWEASLGVPYQWWDYVHNKMLGIFVKPHCDLPIEAVIVWSLVSWTVVVVYEWIFARYNISDLGRDPGFLGQLPPRRPKLGPPWAAVSDSELDLLKIRYSSILANDENVATASAR
jgi:hypothetical protein